MNYKEIETESFGKIQKHIVVFGEGDSYKTFPADESNPEYVAFLAQLEAEAE